MVLKKNLFLKSFIFIFWLLLWMAINTLPEEIKGFGVSFIKSINALRILIPTIISIIIFFFLIKIIFFNTKDIIKYKFNEIYQNTYFLFLIYFILQVIGIYNNNFFTYNFESLFLIYLGVGAICLFLYINYYGLEKSLKYLLLFTIFILISVAVYISYISFKLTQITTTQYYLYGLITADTLFLNQELPRITGISRLWAIINLLAIIVFYNTKNTHVSFFLFLFIVFFGTLIWAAQSRGTLLCYFTLVFIITLFSKNKFLTKIFFIFTFTFLPIIIYTILIVAFNKSSNNLINVPAHNSENIIVSDLKRTDNFKSIIQKSRVIDNKTTSGRLEIWIDLYNRFDKKRFFGYGPQADRNLIGREISKKYSNNASNLYLYALVCGGYLAIAIFFIINIKIIKNLYKAIIMKKLFSSNHKIEIKYSAALLLFFLIRGFIENSYSLFSIDFLLVIISISILEKYLNNKSYKIK